MQKYFNYCKCKYMRNLLLLHSNRAEYLPGQILVCYFLYINGKFSKCTRFYWLFKWNVILTSSCQNKELYGLSNLLRDIFLILFLYSFFPRNFLFLYSIPVLFQLFLFSTCKILLFLLIFINWTLSSYYSVDTEDFFFYIILSDLQGIISCLQITICTHNMSTNSTGGTKYTKTHDSFLNRFYYSLLNTYVIKNRKI